MNRFIACLAASAALSCGIAFAANPVAATRPVDALIDVLDLKQSTLEDAILALQKSVPSFNATIVREPGVPLDYPKITMRLTNVDPGLLLDVITSSYPLISVNPIPGNATQVYAIRIRYDPSLDGGISASEGAKLHVYRLADVVQMLPPDESGKKPLDSVLSLIQAVLSESQDKTPATMRVHEPTMTLIFKGTPDQTKAVEQALAALMYDPRSAPTLQMNRLGAEVSDLRRRLVDQQKQITTLLGATTRPQ